MAEREMDVNEVLSMASWRGRLDVHCLYSGPLAIVHYDDIHDTVPIVVRAT